MSQNGLTMTDRPCRKCGGEMRPGIAMRETVTGGVPDFPGDVSASTFSAGGPGELITVMKCTECGWSVTKTPPTMAAKHERVK